MTHDTRQSTIDTVFLAISSLATLLEARADGERTNLGDLAKAAADVGTITRLILPDAAVLPTLDAVATLSTDDPASFRLLADQLRNAGSLASPTTTLKAQWKTARRLAEVADSLERLVCEASLRAPSADKVLPDTLAADIADEEGFLGTSAPELDWHVRHVHWLFDSEGAVQWSQNTAKWVSIRPVEKRFGGKTYLGLYLGECAQSVSAKFSAETGSIALVPASHNPLIYIPDVEALVFGSASFWSVIRNVDELRTITTAQIQSTWYIAALRSLHGHVGNALMQAAQNVIDVASLRSFELDTSGATIDQQTETQTMLAANGWTTTLHIREKLLRAVRDPSPT